MAATYSVNFCDIRWSVKSREFIRPASAVAFDAPNLFRFRRCPNILIANSVPFTAAISVWVLTNMHLSPFANIDYPCSIMFPDLKCEIKCTQSELVERVPGHRSANEKWCNDWNWRATHPKMKKCALRAPIKPDGIARKWVRYWKIES